MEQFLQQKHGLVKAIQNNLLSNNEQDSTSINDSESDSHLGKINTQVSHHARIKERLKLLKGNMRNQNEKQ